MIFTAILGGCKKTETSVTPTEIAPSPTVIVDKLVEWKDPAGFVFEYPERLKIDNHPDDKVNYANLKISDQENGGEILIMAKDTEYAKVDAWVKSDKAVVGGKVEDILLSGLKAKKITFNDGKTVVGTIDEAILFTIEGNFLTSPRMGEVFETIIESFKMVIPEESSDKPVSEGATNTSDYGNSDFEEIGEDEE